MRSPDPRSVSDQSWLRRVPLPLRRYLSGRLDLQSSLANIFWVFSDKVLRGTLGVAVAIWIARYLGPANFGSLSYAIAFATLFGSFANLGLDGILVRDLVRNPQGRDELLSSALILRLGAGVSASVAAQAAMWAAGPSDREMRILVAIVSSSMLFQAFDVVDLYLQSRIQSRITAISRDAAFLLVVLVKIWLVLAGAGLTALAWTVPLEIALAAQGQVAWFTRAINAHWYVHARWATMRRLLREGWPLVLSSMAIALYMRIDQVMLANLASLQEVGVYAAATRLSEVWYVLPMVIVPSLAPHLTRAHAGAPEMFDRQLRRLYGTLVRLAYLIVVPVTIGAPYLVRWLYGSEFTAAGTILAIHIWTAVFVFLGVAVSTWCVIEGLTRIQLVQTAVGAVANVLLNLVLIPRYGGVGAALATLAAQICSVYLVLAIQDRTRTQFRALSAALVLR